MDTTAIKSRFEQADQYLEAAKEELNRPAEDVVPFMVCRSARNSIGSYFMGYLMKNGILYDSDASVEDLLEKCRAINSSFNTFDVGAITFSKDEEYSAEFDQMENCIRLVLQAQELTGANTSVS